jgi:hypothetical protein
MLDRQFCRVLICSQTLRRPGLAHHDLLCFLVQVLLNTKTLECYPVSFAGFAAGSEQPAAMEQ